MITANSWRKALTKVGRDDLVLDIYGIGVRGCNDLDLLVDRSETTT